MMNKAMKTIWMVDDDEDERLLVKDAFNQIAGIRLIFIGDGEELLTRLLNRKPHEEKKRFPFPDLILLDLNMPALSGLDVLKMIKTDYRSRSIPVIIYTTSDNERDIRECYENGASAYILKPQNCVKMLDIFASLERFWFGTATLPPARSFCKPSPTRQAQANFGSVSSFFGGIGRVVSPF